MADFQFLRVMPVSLQRYLPLFLSHDGDFKDTLGALSHEHERQRQWQIDVGKQFFINTATWGLDDWEAFVGIETDHKLDYQTRRNAILARINYAQTVTLSFLTTLVNLFVAKKNGIVVDHPDQYRLDILLPDGQVTSFENLEAALQLYVPAHLGWTYIAYMNASGAMYVGGVVSSYVKTKIQADTSLDITLYPANYAAAGVIKSAIYTKIEADRYK